MTFGDGSELVIYPLWSRGSILQGQRTVGAGACAFELTKETWDDATSGKQVFVKFQAPW